MSNRSVVVMYHKQADCIFSARDLERKNPTIFDRFIQAYPPAGLQKWHAAGRLDRYTTGLVVFTCHTPYIDLLTRPEHHQNKRYVIETEKRVNQSHLDALMAGVTLSDGIGKALSAAIRSPGVIEVVVDEGRHHLIRRMVSALNLSVLSLHRDQVGTLVLDIPVGTARELTEQEITEKLKLPLISSLSE